MSTSGIIPTYPHFVQTALTVRLPYNWFAADFHNEYSHAYASRGNIFSIVALALFAASVSVIVALRRSGKRKRLGGGRP